MHLSHEGQALRASHPRVMPAVTVISFTAFSSIELCYFFIEINKNSVSHSSPATFWILPSSPPPLQLISPDVFFCSSGISVAQEEEQTSFLLTSRVHKQWHWCFGAVSAKCTLVKELSSSVSLFYDCCPMVGLKDIC